MNLYEKKILYLHREGGDKTAENCGFVSFQRITGGYKLTVQIRQMQDVQAGEEIPVCFVTLMPEKESEQNAGQKSEQLEDQIEVGKLQRDTALCGGTFRIPGNQEEMKLLEKRISVNKITGVRILLQKDQAVSGNFEKQMTRQKEADGEKQERNPENNIGNNPEKEPPGLQATEEADFGRAGFRLIPDKWEQLKQQYELLHPFGDEREFISVKPADFVILRQEYQKLVNNSFLLHGFFNYRHVILGKDVRLGGNGEVCFYLGVPGVFYEREKMVAVMFGFEGFETEGSVEIGKFGYYLRKVEI